MQSAFIMLYNECMGEVIFALTIVGIVVAYAFT